MAKITVVTPSYNQAKYLDETLRSVLSQRDQIHEFFVLDGGSTDGSVDIIRRYAERGGIDYWHSQKDKGQSDAIHQGFTRATGDYLAWLNSDDLFMPNALARVRQALEKNPHWDALTSYHVRIDADSRIISMHRIPRESPRMARWGVHHISQQTCFFRKSLYDRLGGLDLSLHTAMDTELWLRMFQANAVFGHIPAYLAAFRIHQEGKGSSWIDEYAQEKITVHAKYPQFLETRRQHLGLLYYRLTQVLSGRHLLAARETSRNRGKRVTEIFGDWKMVPA